MRYPYILLLLAVANFASCKKRDAEPKGENVLYNVGGPERVRVTKTAKDGNILFAGTGANKVTSFGKLSLKGAIMLYKEYDAADADFIDDFVEVNDGYILSAINGGADADSNWCRLIRIDKDGAVVWSKNMGLVSGVSGSTDIFSADDEGCILVTSGQMWQSQIRRLDGNGNILYTNVLSPGSTPSVSFTLGTDNTFIGFGDDGNYYPDMYSIKKRFTGYDTQTGIEKWEKSTETGYGTPWPSPLCPDGSFIACGSLITNYDIYVLKVSSTGNIDLNKTFSSGKVPTDTKGMRCIPLKDGSGYLLAYKFLNELTIIKLDNSGNEISSKMYTDTEANDYIKDVFYVSGNEYVVMTTQNAFGYKLFGVEL